MRMVLRDKSLAPMVMSLAADLEFESDAASSPLTAIAFSLWSGRGDTTGSCLLSLRSRKGCPRIEADTALDARSEADKVSRRSLRTMLLVLSHGSARDRISCGYATRQWISVIRPRPL